MGFLVPIQFSDQFSDLYLISFKVIEQNFSAETFTVLSEDSDISSESVHIMDGVFFHDAILLKSISIIQLFASEYKSLKIDWNHIFLLDFIFEVSYSITAFGINSHSISG